MSVRLAVQRPKLSRSAAPLAGKWVSSRPAVFRRRERRVRGELRGERETEARRPQGERVGQSHASSCWMQCCLAHVQLVEDAAKAVGGEPACLERVSCAQPLRSTRIVEPPPGEETHEAGELTAGQPVAQRGADGGLLAAGLLAQLLNSSTPGASPHGCHEVGALPEGNTEHLVLGNTTGVCQAANAASSPCR